MGKAAVMDEAAVTDKAVVTDEAAVADKAAVKLQGCAQGSLSAAPSHKVRRRPHKALLAVPLPCALPSDHHPVTGRTPTFKQARGAAPVACTLSMQAVWMQVCVDGRWEVGKDTHRGHHRGVQVASQGISLCRPAVCWLASCTGQNSSRARGGRRPFTLSSLPQLFWHLGKGGVRCSITQAT